MKKMDGMAWTGLIWLRDKWQAIVKTMMDFWVS